MHPLHDPSIYDGIEALGLKDDYQGWRTASHARTFRRLIDHLSPKVVIEVGSWKGNSVCNMALDSRHLDTHFFCCDTWLGSIEHMTDKSPDYKFPRLHGYPTLYYQFLTNIKKAGFADRVTPIPNTSYACADYLSRHKVTAELIYIDGDHSYKGCYEDLCAYQHLLTDRTKSVLFGDDWQVFPGVTEAVQDFSNIHQNDFRLETDDKLWILWPK